MYEKRAELKVGIVVILASIALLALLYFATGGGFWSDWRYVHLRLDAGELSPRKGDPVFLNGVEIGSVDEVVLKREVRRGSALTAEDEAALATDRERMGPGSPQEVREVYVQVVAKLQTDCVLPVGTEGMISESVTGARTLALLPSRSMRDLTDEETVRSPIRVRQVPTLDSLGDRLGEVMDQTTGVVAMANGTLEEIRGLVTDLRTTIREGRLDALVADVREAAASFRRTVQQVEGDIGEITGNVTRATADLREVAAAATRITSALEKDIPAALADVRKAAAKMSDLMDRAAPKIEDFLDDMGRTGRNLVSLSGEFAGIGSEAKQVVVDLGRDLNELAELLTDTGRNLLDASEDLRAHPWKLLKEPSTDEIAYENLRATMVNYVRAMQRMNTTAQTLRTILERGDMEDSSVRGLLQRTLAAFERSVDRYRSSETRMMQLLEAGAPSDRPGASSPPPPPPPPPPR